MVRENSSSMCLVVFLQNSWSPVYAGTTWPRASWLLALQRSRSGQRLKILTRDFEVCENTTPIVGPTASSKVPPDEAHIQRVLARTRPTIVIACGKQAETVLAKLWAGALIAVPHPAHRFLTDALYIEAKKLLNEGFAGRIKLHQEIGKVERIDL